MLAHNRDEEKEHAAMMLEWLRRHDAKLDEHLRTYLFTNKSAAGDRRGSRGQGQRWRRQVVGRRREPRHREPAEMNDLLREQAPISAQAWAEIDAEAKRTLKTLLAARRLVDFEGPLGWAAAAVPTGRS